MTEVGSTWHSEIVPGNVPGGANTSHTIMIPSLAVLLEHVPSDARHEAYEHEALENNVLGKGTEGSRRRTFRYLRELYLLRPDALLFRALRDLWPVDPLARPLLAGLCSTARDPVFRASGAAIVGAAPGELVTSAALAEAVEERYPGKYGATTLAKIGRNTFSSWEQTGHLVAGEKRAKTRVRADCRPADVAYALLLGYVDGGRGQTLFETPWTKVLDRPTAQLYELASAASQAGLIEMRRAGGVVEVGFDALLRPFETEAQGTLV
ncbi:hypothetical protein [Miltoncostaea oceani]|uniref:hypothetical protein n=1 Tax=Miltoncostaea oceani TaxID=2843216 RepID=UPI001C3D3F89|nr:hypothetical protein [Miltoncostaea oceani]